MRVAKRIIRIFTRPAGRRSSFEHRFVSFWYANDRHTTMVGHVGDSRLKKESNRITAPTINNQQLCRRCRLCTTRRCTGPSTNPTTSQHSQQATRKVDTDTYTHQPSTNKQQQKRERDDVPLPFDPMGKRLIRFVLEGDETMSVFVTVLDEFLVFLSPLFQVGGTELELGRRRGGRRRCRGR